MSKTHSYGAISNDTGHQGITRQLLGGVGVCYWKQLINGMHLDGHLHCVEYVVVPSGSSIGTHRHERTEEIYYILNGSATMDLNGKPLQVAAGDLILTPLGASHGIANFSRQDIAFFVVEAFPGRAEPGMQREPVRIPLRSQMKPATSLLEVEANAWLRSASVDLSRYFSGNWAQVTVLQLPAAEELDFSQGEGRDEVLFVVEGEAEITFEEEYVCGGTGLCLAMPASMSRRIANPSSDSPLEVVRVEVYQTEH
jgi:mannose-6-phosphate isomerase-like protein (cupin superfamily)